MKPQASVKLFFQSVLDQGMCFEGFSAIEIMFPLVLVSQCVDFSLFSYLGLDYHHASCVLWNFKLASTSNSSSQNISTKTHLQILHLGQTP